MNEPITAQYHGVCTAWHDRKHQQGRENEQARQRIAPPGRYTPLVPRPEGGAVPIMVAQQSDDNRPPRRRHVERAA